MHPYSPERRTALVLCGTGAHGAYHAGALRALQEAGVKIDVVAGQGVGAAGAAVAAIDGAATLWAEGGLWRSPSVASLYPVRRAVRLGATLVLAIVALMLLAVAVTAAGIPVQTLARVALGAALLGAATAVVLARVKGGARRRAIGAWWWRFLGAPIDAAPMRARVAGAIWQLIRGAAPDASPSGAVFGRRYSEWLSENLSQPGFRELMVIATDVDTRRDVVAALLREPYRQAFVASRPGRERKAEVIDLAGAGRDHALDIVAGALTPPLGCDLHPITFAPDSFWRGETHRLCDHPGSIGRLLTELEMAGVTQAILVSATASETAPHRLTSPRLDIRGRIGEFVAAAQSAAIREALDAPRARFDGIYVICPAHNPVGPFDVGGAYDEASDRRHTLLELMERAYQDAYHQFIEPVVGASGDHLARPAPPD